MKHSREDYGCIQDATHAEHLAKIVIYMVANGMMNINDEFKELLIDQCIKSFGFDFEVDNITPEIKQAIIDEFSVEMPKLPFNYKMKIAYDEPVFLIRAIDYTSGFIVRMWANAVNLLGGKQEIISSAMEHSLVMDSYKIMKKIPDLPVKPEPVQADVTTSPVPDSSV